MTHRGNAERCSSVRMREVLSCGWYGCCCAESDCRNRTVGRRQVFPDSVQSARKGPRRATEQTKITVQTNDGLVITMRGSKRLGSKSESRYERRIACCCCCCNSKSELVGVCVCGPRLIQPGCSESTLTEYICPSLRELCSAVKSLYNCRKQAP